MFPLEDINLPAPSQDATVAAEHTATVVIRFTNLRDFSQKERSKSQYPEAPKAEATARPRKSLCDSPSMLRSGDNKKGEKTVSTLMAATSVTKMTAFPSVTT